MIEVSEIIIIDKPYTQPPPSAAAVLPTTAPATKTTLPPLYTNLQWETVQNKSLTFTSGKRKIQQEGIYRESQPLSDYPQDFVDYYNTNLLEAGFKPVLNSAEAGSITITYTRDDLFLTFGVKESKSGYLAFIEHN